MLVCCDQAEPSPDLVAWTPTIESIRYLDVHPVLPEGSPDTLLHSYRALLVPLLLNSALCAMKLQPRPNPPLAVKYTTRALNINDYELSPTDKGKALYRRALAAIALKDEDDAFQDLQAANTIVPDDVAIKAELTKLKGKQKEKREKEKKAYKNMFG